jgi:hypothetical protein
VKERGGGLKEGGIAMQYITIALSYRLVALSRRWEGAVVVSIPSLRADCLPKLHVPNSE